MIVRLAGEQDAPGLIELASQVEDWFGPMAGDPGFRAVLDRHIGRGTALVAVDAGQAGLLGGLLFSARPPAYHVRWLVVSGPARRQGPAEPSWRRLCAGSYPAPAWWKW